MEQSDDFPEWQQILALLKAQQNTLYGISRMAKPSISDNNLNLEFSFAFHLRRVSEPRNMEAIAKITSEVLGREVDVKTNTVEGVKLVQITNFKEENAVAPVLYLSTFKVKNFRVLDDVCFTFQPGLNVLLGANNAGKTAIIDALRYIFNLGTYQKRDDIIRIDDQDIHIGNTPLKNEELIEFEATFISPDKGVVGQLNDMYDVEKDGQHIFKLKHQIVMNFDGTIGRHVFKKSTSTGGADYLNPVSQDSLDFIHSVYLSAMRDIVEDGAKVGMEIERLIRSQVKTTLDHGKLNKLPDDLRTKVLEDIHGVTGSDYLDIISANLSSYAMPYFKELTKDLISFFPSSINRNLYRSMRPIFSHESHGLAGLDLQANGLGLNNLIYASIVLSRVSDDESFRFFMIEEPEAHLHPQVQKTFFNRLNKIGNHQVFVTSHSPTITAAVDVDRIIVVKRLSDEVNITHLKSLYPADNSEKQISKRYLEKFLDATKSQLLFSDAVIFVEGISEALLLQKFSEMLGLSLRDSGVEIVILGAKDGFAHFKPLFDANPTWKCAQITDDDRKWADIDSNENDLPESNSLSPRIYRGVGTFEYELLKTASNADTADSDNKYRVAKLRTAFTKAKPKGANTFYDDDLKLSYKRMKNKAKDTEWGSEGLTSNSYFKSTKSEFAFQLESILTNDDKDMIPLYIAEAIKYITKDH